MQSLLNRLREHPDDANAWQRFDTLCRPLLQQWLRRYSLQPHDADDLVQQVLEVVVRELPHFHYDPQKGTFLGWLRAILCNRLREHWRSLQARPVATGGSDFNEAVLNQLIDHRSDPERVWDREHARHVLRRLLARIEPDLSPTTWQAFLRILGGGKPADVAADLNISVNAAYLAKSAVLKKLRQEIADLLE
jgi:RNA polymerase sigma-70 factor (ECF subfamily)